MHDAYTVSLLHMNGADASTTFTDESGKTWTANGNAQIDTTYSKFNGASALFDGSGDWIDTPDSSDFTLGANDFTIDLWVKKNANNVTQYFAGQLNSAATPSTLSFELAFNNVNKLVSYWQWGAGASDYLTVTSSGTITDTSWHHLAFVRSGNTITQYIDGVADGSADATGKTINDSPNKLAVGRTGEYTPFTWNGWIDEFRISKGIARWTANFTPPTREYGLNVAGGQGSFAYTGQSANTLIGRLVTAVYGAFTYTGQTVAFILAKGILAAYGAYTYTGNSILLAAVKFFAAIHLLSTNNSISVIGQDNSKKVRE